MDNNKSIFFEEQIQKADASIDECIDEILAIHQDQLEKLKTEVSELFSESFSSDTSDHYEWFEEKINFNKNKLNKLNQCLLNIIEVESLVEKIFQKSKGDLGYLSVIQNTDHYNDDEEIINKAKDVGIRFVVEVERSYYQTTLNSIGELYSLVKEELEETKMENDNLIKETES